MGGHGHSSFGLGFCWWGIMVYRPALLDVFEVEIPFFIDEMLAKLYSHILFNYVRAATSTL